MIPTSLSDLIVIYLLMLLAATFGMWLLRDTFRRMREKRSSRDHFVCRICGVSFVSRGKESLVRCPECESLNERGDCREI
jgi:ribosomal protein L37AE/L43A